ncbi:MAG: rRNA methyltransferase [Burkholderiales bacterium]|nr:rRNA methyltransferase [Burkholderiales bacterium]
MERKPRGHVKPTRSVSSNRWMHEHVTDPYVQEARKRGYRSRAAFKILEIDQKARLLRRGMLVVDLGAAPGGWSQVVAQRIGGGEHGGGRVVAVDLLDMAGLPGVDFVRADFSTDAGLAEVARRLGPGRRADLVLSDMAPNISGIGAADQARSIGLAELALDFARRFLKPDGALVVKVFQGQGFPEFLKQMRASFHDVKSHKPKASRDRSAEVFLVGRQLREDSVESTE